MAKRANHPHPGYRAARASIAALGLGVVLSGCSDDPGIRTAVPTTGDSPATSATASPAEADEAAVERLVTERYLEFQQVVAESGAASDPDDPRLVEYATGAVLDNLLGKLAVRKQAGTRLYGAPVPDVQSVTVTGDDATVKDCLDNSSTGLEDAAGNKLSVGRDRQETTATLMLVDGTWKVSEIATVAGGGSC
jgi:hypothetical protein